MKVFTFVKEALEDVNVDSDLFYDLTDGGYIHPEELLEDKELAQSINDAGKLLKKFFHALTEAVEE